MSSHILYPWFLSVTAIRFTNSCAPQLYDIMMCLPLVAAGLFLDKRNYFRVRWRNRGGSRKTGKIRVSDWVLSTHIVNSIEIFFKCLHLTVWYTLDDLLNYLKSSQFDYPITNLCVESKIPQCLKILSHNQKNKI